MKIFQFNCKTPGLEYPLEGIKPPEQDRIKNARELLHVDQYKGYLAH